MYAFNGQFALWTTDSKPFPSPVNSFLQLLSETHFLPRSPVGATPRASVPRLSVRRPSGPSGSLSGKPFPCLLSNQSTLLPQTPLCYLISSPSGKSGIIPLTSPRNCWSKRFRNSSASIPLFILTVSSCLRGEVSLSCLQLVYSTSPSWGFAHWSAPLDSWYL